VIRKIIHVFSGLVLVTDAISLMGLPCGEHFLGKQKIEIKGKSAVIAGTETLCGRYYVYIDNYSSCNNFANFYWAVWKKIKFCFSKINHF